MVVRRLVDKTKIDLGVLRLDDVDWIDLAQYREL
jgi:hypothetical protein